ncbi:MAG: response regulator [Chloroflexi bacterium]|nr:response regulator [Chloroflexota bacterium]
MARILVVDDNGASRLSLTQQLTAGGYQALESSDSIDSLRVITREQPDIVMVEVLMPRLDGFSLCRQLKSDPATAAIPIVLLTRTPPTPEDESFAMSVGAEHYLVKPVAKEVLLALIGRLALRSRVLPLAVQNESDYLRGYISRLRQQIREKSKEIEQARLQAEQTRSEVAQARSEWLKGEFDELNRQLQRARARLEDLQTRAVAPARLRINADVLNDMRGMITMIVRSSDLLLRGVYGALPEPQAERLMIIRESARRVLEILVAVELPGPSGGFSKRLKTQDPS